MFTKLFFIKFAKINVLKVFLTSFSHTSLTTERRLTGWWVLALDLSPPFFNTKITDETYQNSGKQDSFRHTLKSSAKMYGSSGSQFFRTTSWIQLGPDVFDKSRLVNAYFNQLES